MSWSILCEQKLTCALYGFETASRSLCYKIVNSETTNLISIQNVTWNEKTWFKVKLRLTHNFQVVQCDIWDKISFYQWLQHEIRSTMYINVHIRVIQHCNLCILHRLLNLFNFNNQVGLKLWLTFSCLSEKGTPLILHIRGYL